MRIIHRYVAAHFLKTFVICLLSLLGLYIVVDGFNQLDSFVEYAEVHGGFLQVVAKYYFYSSLAVFERTSAVITLIAAMFTVTWLQRYHELTALMAAGISKARVFAPIFAVAMMISLLTSAGRETIIPAVRDEAGLSRNAQDLGGQRKKMFDPLYDNRTSVLFQGSAAQAEGRRILNPDFHLPRNLARYGTKLLAKEARYESASGQHPAGYRLIGVSRPTKLNEKESLFLDGKPVLITPRDADWLQANEAFIVSEVTFEQLAGGWAFRQYASTAELVDGLRNPSLSFGANVRVAVHARLLQPVLDLTLLLLGLPIVVTKQNRSAFLAIGYAIGIVATFMVTVMVCHELGKQVLLSPALAAWLPCLIFVPLALALSGPLFEWENPESESVDVSSLHEMTYTTASEKSGDPRSGRELLWIRLLGTSKRKVHGPAARKKE